jgi:hypothetical protein
MPQLLKTLIINKPSLCHNNVMKGVAVLKIVTGVALAINALQQLFSHQTWWFIQNVNLIFHEAGHVLFMFFGRFLHILGGSLLEILIPLLITFYFAAKRQFFSATCTSWWLATAFLSVSIYAADARERALPLLGGGNVGHDWFNLLTILGWLQHDDLVGYMFWLLSLISIAILVFLLTKDKDIKSLLNSV